MLVVNFVGNIVKVRRAKDVGNQDFSRAVLLILAVTIDRGTVSDWLPKKDSANFESDTFLWLAYVVNMSKIATFSGRFWILA